MIKLSTECTPNRQMPTQTINSLTLHSPLFPMHVKSVMIHDSDDTQAQGLKMTFKFNEKKKGKRIYNQLFYSLN